MKNISRRGLVKGLVAGAVILGFDPMARSWVTEARADTPILAVPPLDGVFSTDPGALAAAAETLAGLDPTSMLPGSLVLFYPFRAAPLRRPLFRVPNEEVFFLFDILLTTPQVSSIVNDVLQRNRALYDQNVAQGGMSYVISAVDLSPHDWKKHFDPEWGRLVSAKRRFDPGNVLGPGPGVFP